MSAFILGKSLVSSRERIRGKLTHENLVASRKRKGRGVDHYLLAREGEERCREEFQRLLPSYTKKGEEGKKSLYTQSDEREEKNSIKKNLSLFRWENPLFAGRVGGEEASRKRQLSTRTSFPTERRSLLIGGRKGKRRGPGAACYQKGGKETLLLKRWGGSR